MVDTSDSPGSNQVNYELKPSASHVKTKVNQTKNRPKQMFKFINTAISNVKDLLSGVSQNVDDVLIPIVQSEPPTKEEMDELTTKLNTSMEKVSQKISTETPDDIATDEITHEEANQVEAAQLALPTDFENTKKWTPSNLVQFIKEINTLHPGAIKYSSKTNRRQLVKSIKKFFSQEQLATA